MFLLYLNSFISGSFSLLLVVAFFFWLISAWWWLISFFNSLILNSLSLSSFSLSFRIKSFFSSYSLFCWSSPSIMWILSFQVFYDSFLYFYNSAICLSSSAIISGVMFCWDGSYFTELFLAFDFSFSFDSLIFCSISLILACFVR